MKNKWLYTYNAKPKDVNNEDYFCKEHNIMRTSEIENNAAWYAFIDEVGLKSRLLCIAIYPCDWAAKCMY